MSHFPARMHRAYDYNAMEQNLSKKIESKSKLKNIKISRNSNNYLPCGYIK